MKNIVNLADVELKPRHKSFAATGNAADKFDARTAAVSDKLGAKKLGYNVTAVPPGKCAYPFHNHHANEELFLVLEGTGQFRFGAETAAIKPMDVIACPPGGPESAHQIYNDGETDIKYLAISTLEPHEYVEYPDSGKFGVFGVRADGDQERIAFLGRTDDGLDYWDGE